MQKLLFSAVALLSACVSVQPTRARQEVAQLVEQRTGIRNVIPAKQDEQSREQVRAKVTQLLKQPLTLGSALQIAMLNNRELKATFEELGIAQAELVQAGLLANPVIAGDLVISTTGNGLGGGLSLSQSLLSAFLIPAKRRLAKRRLAHAIVTVGQAALTTARDVKIAYVTFQAAMASFDLQRSLSQAAEIADTLAQNQLEAGNVSSLDRQLFAAALDKARVELAEAQLNITIAREELNRLLGLWGEQTSWTLYAPLAEISPIATDFAAFEAQAIRHRLDLSAARFEVESLEYTLKLRRRSLVPQIDVGIEARNEVGNDPGHEWVLGPSLALELPLFDPGHADFARLQAYLRQAQHRLQDLAIVARSEVRLLREKLIAAQRKVEYYQKTILPRAQAIVDLTLEQYNAMQVGTYQLLESRSHQLEAQCAYIEALRDYWIAHSELELAVGGW